MSRLASIPILSFQLHYHNPLTFCCLNDLAAYQIGGAGITCICCQGCYLAATEKKWAQSDMPPTGVQKSFEICYLSDAISCILGSFFSLIYTRKVRSKSVGKLCIFF